MTPGYFFLLTIKNDKGSSSSPAELG